MVLSPPGDRKSGTAQPGALGTVLDLRPLTVATFNAHLGVDRRFRPYDVVAACLALDADVLAVEEALWPASGGQRRPGFVEEVGRLGGYEVHASATARLAWRRAGYVLARPGQAVVGWTGLAVLSRVPVLSSTDFLLRELRRDPSRRGAVVVEVEVGGAPVVFTAVHLSHLTRGSLLQVASLRRRLPDDRAGVLVGDMNMWGPLLSAALPGWRRAVRGRTWPARRPHSQIDHVMVNRHVEVEEGRRMPWSGSDHRALVARITPRRAEP